MPKVIHILRKFVPSEWGGIESHLVGLIPELERLGWTSEVHAPREAGTDGGPLEAVGATFRTFTARYPCLRMRAEDRARLCASGGNLVSVHELAQLLRDRSAAVLHVHALRRLGGVVRTAARFAHIPYAVTIHSPVRTGPAPRPGAAPARRLYDVGAPFGLLVGSNRVVRDADLVWALNEPERAAWAPDRGTRHLERLSLGVDARPASPDERVEARRLVAGLGDAPFAAMIARIDPMKGHDIAIEAFARAAPRGMHLVLAGASMDEAYSGQLRLRAQPLADRVHFVGNIPPRSARALLAESTIALIPSRAEAFGLTLPEAWAQSACALFSDLGGLHDTAEAVGARYGRVAEPTPEAWARRIADALGDEAGMRRERAEAPARVAERFTWRAVAERIAAGYRRATLGWWPT